MDLWGTLGISSRTGLFVVAGGLLTALIMGALLLVRRSRASATTSLGLNDHR